MGRVAAADRLGMQLALRKLSILLRRPGQGLQAALRKDGGLYGRVVWRTVDRGRVGFFLGFLTDGRGWEHVRADPPEAAVFAFVEPVGSRLHARLAGRRGGLFDRTADEARRQGVPFELHRDRSAALLRHRSVRGMPPEVLALTAQDFFATAMRSLWASDFFVRLRKVRPAASRRRGERLHR